MALSNLSWEYHRHRANPEIAEAIDQLRAFGQLLIHASSIQLYPWH